MNTNAKETIKATLSIESVVGSYIKLEHSGKNFRACCPFHGEKTPSFYVTPDRGIYYCYGCHKGGDIFSFVQEIEGIEFYDALKSLAEKAGVSLDPSTGSGQGKPSRIGILREIMESATKFYEIGLRTDKSVVDYLLGRGMTKETMVTWRIGYAPKGWSGLYDYLKSKKYSDADILATGLCLEGKQSGLYDRFRERIMFPISDAQGHVIAFTGRIMPGTEESQKPVGKYINSPETDLYHKSAVLFGFDKAKASIHSENFVILVEGQMDCIMSHQVGITNVVALSGTASTDLHMKQIARFTHHIVICLDADQAGLAAAQRTAMVAYAHDMKVLVIDTSPSTHSGQAKDPADMIAEHPEAWVQTTKHRKDFIAFRLEKMKQQGKTEDKVAIAQKELFPILAHIQSQITLDDRLQEIAHAFGSSTVDPVRKEFEKFMQHQATEIKQVLEQPLSKEITSQRKLIEEKIIGIYLSLRDQEGAEDVNQRMIQLGEPIMNHVNQLTDQQQQEYMFRVEQELGTLPDSLLLYQRVFKTESIQYEKLMIDDAIKKISALFAHDTDNSDLLKQLHMLQVRKDELTRALH